MNTQEERNEIERMENEGGKSAWWNDTTRNEPFTNPAAQRATNPERMLAEYREKQAQTAIEMADRVHKEREEFVKEVNREICRQHRIADERNYREAIAHALKVTAKNRGEFKPYLAYSYAGQGWVEVLSEPQGQPPRRLCKRPTCDATFLVPDSLLQGAPATGD